CVRDRGPAVRALILVTHRSVGPERHGVQRTQSPRSVPEALVPPRPHRERERRALRGRGGRLPEPDVREVRPGDPQTAAAGRLSALRPEGGLAAARGVPDPGGDEGRSRVARGTGAEAGDRFGGPGPHGPG